ncbi:LacI family DNA-binding transcriptional regulator [Microbacterium sp. NPDC091662]|uniref:LacI family DNA-binding transcriptional regulator n=1 Tax=Microbacterium sp. NPDC091662 TaxID=3364211 RepID=UPI0038023037
MQEKSDGRNRSGVTLLEVADLAGVSLKTASRALNDEKYVSVPTKARVVAAAQELGYHLNSTASQLRRGISSGFVAFIAGDLANPFYSSLAKGIESEARLQGMQMTLASSDEDPETEATLLQEFLSRNVEAIILVPTDTSHERAEALQRERVPIVFVDRVPRGVTADSIVLDNQAGARAAVEHLIDVGHERIAFIGDYPRLQTHEERLAGYRDAVQRVPERFREVYVRSGLHDVPGARDAVRLLMELDEPPTAYFTSNNRVTVGATLAFRGVTSPPALVGFDDLDVFEHLGITVMAHDPVEMGRAAARMAIERSVALAGGRHSVVVETRLVARGSGEIPPRD